MGLERPAQLLMLERLVVPCSSISNAGMCFVSFGNELSFLPYVEVPRVLPEYCGDRVLTMSLFVDGMHLDDLVRARPSRALRDRIGENLVELFYAQVLRIGAFHADSHWGNYLFRAAGIGLVDFGCVKVPACGLPFEPA